MFRTCETFKVKLLAASRRRGLVVRSTSYVAETALSNEINMCVIHVWNIIMFRHKFASTTCAFLQQSRGTDKQDTTRSTLMMWGCWNSGFASCVVAAMKVCTSTMQFRICWRSKACVCAKEHTKATKGARIIARVMALNTQSSDDQGSISNLLKY